MCHVVLDFTEAFMTTLGGRWSFPHFMDEKTEAQTVNNLPKVSATQWWSWSWRPGLYHSKLYFSLPQCTPHLAVSGSSAGRIATSESPANHSEFVDTIAFKQLSHKMSRIFTYGLLQQIFLLFRKFFCWSRSLKVMASPGTILVKLPKLGRPLLKV